jgi:DNA-binding response OmpR family regulator
MRVLVIEDEARIAEILQEALSRAGFIVDRATRCAEAREALSLTAYDTVVLDLGLPDGDGLTLLTDLQSSRNRVPAWFLLRATPCRIGYLVSTRGLTTIS